MCVGTTSIPKFTFMWYIYIGFSQMPTSPVSENLLYQQRLFSIAWHSSIGKCHVSTQGFSNYTRLYSLRPSAIHILRRMYCLDDEAMSWSNPCFDTFIANEPNLCGDVEDNRICRHTNCIASSTTFEAKIKYVQISPKMKIAPLTQKLQILRGFRIGTYFFRSYAMQK